jgi:hypothetical protein
MLLGQPLAEGRLDLDSPWSNALQLCADRRHQSLAPEAGSNPGPEVGVAWLEGLRHAPMISLSGVLLPTRIGLA